MNSNNPLDGNNTPLFQQSHLWYARVQKHVSSAASCSQVGCLLSFYGVYAFALLSLPEAVGSSGIAKKRIMGKDICQKK
jgi:hypothetical protein